MDPFDEFRRRLEDAENRGDPEPIVALLADDAVVIVPDFPVHESGAACAAFIRDLLPGLLEAFDRRITYRSSEVVLAGDRAFDRGEFSFTVRPRDGGDTVTEHGKYFWVYARTAQGWKLWRLVMTLDERAEPQEEHGDDAHTTLWLRGRRTVGRLWARLTRGV